MAEHNGNEVLLDVRGLTKHFPVRRGVLQRTVGWIRAVEDVSFRLRRGETLGLVGESGCGKTTVLRLIGRALMPTHGGILLRTPDGYLDVATADADNLVGVRRKVRMVFQDPDSSLNPRMTVRAILSEPLIINRVCKERGELHEAVGNLMLKVGMQREQLSRYPHTLSGGQKQRIAIARALALEPDLLLADEPTSALDVSVQAQILNLLLRLQAEMNLGIIFVTHDLGVVRHISDNVAVMYLGSLVELGQRDEVFRKPHHPYTEALFSSIPEPNPRVRRKRIQLKGDVPEIIKRPEGCPFHPRCGYARSVCREKRPELRAAGATARQVACHLAQELDLAGERRQS